MVSMVDIVAIPVIFVAGIIGCLLPYFLRNNFNATNVIKLGNAFAAGVLTAAGLVHLLPDAATDLEDYEYPIASAVAGASYLLTLIVEIAAVSGLATAQEKDEETVENTPENVQETNIESHENMALLPTAHAHTDVLVKSHSKQTETRFRILSLILLMALMVHSFIAGLALSLSGSQAAWGILVAILAHKTFAAFSLGASVVRAKWSVPKALGLFAAFTISTPLGVGIGMVTQDVEDNLVVPLLQAVAAGVFLYMGTWHLLQDALAFRKKILAICIFAVGYAAMAALALWS